MSDSEWERREPPRWLDAVPSAGLFDAVTHPSDAAAALAVGGPGAAAATALEVLDPQRLDAAGRVDLLVALERQLAWLSGLQQRVLATMDAHRGETVDPMGRDWVREDVGCALRLAGQTAQDRLDVARTLTARLPRTLELLDTGAISYLHARSLAEAVEPYPDEVVGQIETRAHRRVGEQTVGEFRASVRRAVQAADPRGSNERRSAAMKDRRVCVRPLDDGMASLWALLPAEGAAAIMAVLDAMAAGTWDGDPRTVDQRRADALVDLAGAALYDDALPKAQGLRPSVHVTVALSTLLGLDQIPGELAGHGPIPAEVARRLAGDPTGTWRRMVLDPVNGQLIDYGRRTYRPPADLRRFVIARDQTCVFPRCQRLAERCEIDHRAQYSRGGGTSELNNQALCTRHHPAKDEAGWQVEPEPGGGYTWIAPTGHRYRTHAPEYPINEPERTPARQDESPDDRDPPPL